MVAIITAEQAEGEAEDMQLAVVAEGEELLQQGAREGQGETEASRRVRKAEEVEEVPIVA
jgi:hypothetical protein